MAESTMYTALLYNKSSTWQKLVCIKDYPDQKGADETIETTTLCDTKHTYIPGLGSGSQSYSFKANFTKADYKAIEALEGTEQTFRLNFGKASDDNQIQFECKGFVSVYYNQGDVNAVREMTVVIIPTDGGFVAKDDNVTFTD